MVQTMTSPISKFYEDHDRLQAEFEAEYLRPGRRGRPRKADAGPNNDATTKSFKSAKGKKGARGHAKPKKM